MIAYGLIKILDFQFILPEEVYNLQLYKIDGVTLAWVFLGYSSWFSKLLGFFELIPGILLLFNRTKYLGALLLFPSLTAIFLINNAYGFLLHMRIFTGILLTIDVAILYTVRSLIYQFLLEIIKQKNFKFEVVLNVILVIAILFIILYIN